MKKAILIFAYCLFFSCYLLSQPKFEFRAAWIATVDNIDWPSKGNHNPESQRAEFIAQLEMHKRNGINAVIVQVRPAADAFYPSSFEPWSEWLTGKQGQPPTPYYDPLRFMIEETHKRGMLFHAWCNPYRATFKIGESTVSATHITRVHPDWFLTYGDTRYFDPGNKEVQKYVADVISDMVSRYDVDGLHFDDYFYPYRIAGKEFPDDASFSRYGNGMNKEDWRRSNTDSIILLLSTSIKKIKKDCVFGISPFGVWRNKSRDPEGSDTKAGQTNYDDLYADILLWLKKGWIDYVAPQLYWEFGHRAAPFEVLLDWWNQHSYGRHCYIGLGIYKAGANAAWREKSQLPRQIAAIRKEANVQGMIFFSSTSFQRNPNGWNDSLQLNYFRDPALAPPMPWIDSVAPAAPSFNISEARGDSVIIGANKSILAKTQRLLVLYCFPDEKSMDKNNVAAIRKVFPGTEFLSTEAMPKEWNSCVWAVTSVSENNNESEFGTVRRFIKDDKGQWKYQAGPK